MSQTSEIVHEANDKCQKENNQDNNSMAIMTWHDSYATLEETVSDTKVSFVCTSLESFNNTSVHNKKDNPLGMPYGAINRFIAGESLGFIAGESLGLSLEPGFAINRFLYGDSRPRGNRGLSGAFR
jgi:hypothetical protein